MSLRNTPTPKPANEAWKINAKHGAVLIPVKNMTLPDIWNDDAFHFFGKSSIILVCKSRVNVSQC